MTRTALMEPHETNEPEPRMWLFIRKDLPMPPGKLAAQAGHGYATCLWLSGDRNPDMVARYMSGEYGKIAVGVRNEAELIACVDACKPAGLVAVAIKDAARTFFSEPTWTVGAIGPCFRSDLPKKVQGLRLFENWETSIGESKLG